MIRTPAWQVVVVMLQMKTYMKVMKSGRLQEFGSGRDCVYKCILCKCNCSLVNVIICVLWGQL